MLRRNGIAGALLLLLMHGGASSARGENPRDWGNLARLTAGERIRVSAETGEHRGDFLRYTDTALTIREGGREVQFNRQEVDRVESGARPRRLRNVLIGAAIGVGVAAVTDATLGQRLRNESNPSGVRPVIWTVPIGIGAAIGAAMPGRQVVYRR